MIVCDFCAQYQEDGKCRLDLKVPKAMVCNKFDPTLERFCSDAKDFVSQHQIVQMATFFGIKGMEMKKVKLMAARAEEVRP